MSEESLIQRALAKRMPAKDQRALVLLTGARQTGKTTLARHIYPELRHLNLDAIETRDQLRQVSTFAWARTVGPAVIDEAQKAPELFEKIKFAYDEGRLQFTALLGSAQILLLRKVRETLAGRLLLRELWPLMPSEIRQTRQGGGQAPLLERLLSASDPQALLESEPEILVGEENELRRELEEYLLQWGGMPALMTLTAEQRRDWLAGYEVTYLERDLADLSRLNDLLPFRKCQRLAALHTAQLLNYSELARDAGVSVETARRYLEYLRVSYQAWFLEPYAGNLRKRLVKTPKLYWVDLGVWRHLTGRWGPVDGFAFETYVVTEVMKLLSACGGTARLSFFRTLAGLEADLIIEGEHGVIGAEVRLAERVASSDGAALRRASADIGPRWRLGLVIYRGSRLFRLSDGIWAVPSTRALG